MPRSVEQRRTCQQTPRRIPVRPDSEPAPPGSGTVPSSAGGCRRPRRRRRPLRSTRAAARARRTIAVRESRGRRAARMAASATAMASIGRLHHPSRPAAPGRAGVVTSRQSSPSSDRRRAAARSRRERTPEAEIPSARPISVESNPDTWRKASTSRSSSDSRASAVARSVWAARVDGSWMSEPTSATSISTTGRRRWRRITWRTSFAAIVTSHGRRLPASRSVAEPAPRDRPRGLDRILRHVLVATDNEADARHVIVVRVHDPGERHGVTRRRVGDDRGRAMPRWVTPARAPCPTDVEWRGSVRPRWVSRRPPRHTRGPGWHPPGALRRR